MNIVHVTQQIKLTYCRLEAFEWNIQRLKYRQKVLNLYVILIIECPVVFFQHGSLNDIPAPLASKFVQKGINYAVLAPLPFLTILKVIKKLENHLSNSA